MPDFATDLVPNLRPGVQLEAAARVLVDPVFARRIKLDDAGLAILGAMAGSTDVSPASVGVVGPGGTRSVGALAVAAGVSEAQVATWLGRLAAYDLLDTPTARARMADRAALEAVRSAPADHLRPLPGARFACTLCGSCCGGHIVGPVSPPIVAGVEAHEAAFEAAIRATRKADKGLFFVLPSQRAVPGEDVACHAAGGSCVFLDDAGLCTIHQRLGGDRKPLPCRIFPYELTATPDGVRVAVQRECRDFLRATDEGQPTLGESEAELRALLAEAPAPVAASLAPRIREERVADWAAYRAVEVELLRVTEGAASGDAAGDAAALFVGLREVVGARPADPGATFLAWRDGLLAPLQQILAAVPPSDAEVTFRVDALALAVQALEEARGWALVRATGPLEADAARLLGDHVRHAIWSLGPLRATSLAAGLARLHAEWLLARLIALSRARAVKRFHLTAQDLQDGLATAAFLFRHKDLHPLLERLDPLTTAVFLDAPGRPREAAEREPDTRLELPKF
jgi:Fe-S-cluster containining protein